MQLFVEFYEFIQYFIASFFFDVSLKLFLFPLHELLIVFLNFLTNLLNFSLNSIKHYLIYSIHIVLTRYHQQFFSEQS